MAINKKSVKGTAAIKLRDTLSSNDGAVLTLVETWVGPYEELRIKQLSVILAVKNTALSPTTAGEGELRITSEKDLSADGSSSNRPPSVVTIEVIWQELRQPIKQSPFYKNLLSSQVLRVEAEVAKGAEGIAPDDAVEGKLYDDLIAEREYVTAVPVVRRTTTNVQGNVGSGNAWFRDDPPVEVQGEWEFMKSADERRETGRRFDQIEEWLGAEVWDADHYP